MPRSSRTQRLLSAAALGGFALVSVAQCATAAPVQSSQNVVCAFPLLGDQPVTIDLTADVALQVLPEPTPAVPVLVRARLVGETSLGPDTILRGAQLRASWVFPAVTGATTTEPRVASLRSTFESGPLQGAIAGFTPRAPGSAQLLIDGVTLSLGFVDASGATIPELGTSTDSDGDPSTADVPCVGPSVKLADVTVVTRLNGAPTPGPSQTPTPTLTPTPGPTPTQVPPTPQPTPVPTALPTPCCSTLPVFRYATAGKAYLKSIAAGAVDISGTSKFEYVLSTGATTGTITLADAAANVKAFRLLPITANLSFTEVGQTTGTLAPDLTLSVQTRQVIRLKNAKVFGINLVSSTCVTSSPATIPLKSAAGGFKPTSGGTLNGTFTVPSFKGCGALTSLVSGLTAGSGNGITLALKPAV